MRKIVIFFIFLLYCLPGISQVVYEDITNVGIYEFLDELANLRLITLNSAIKPYSRTYIADKLYEATTADEQVNPKTGEPSHILNKRQKKELSFYLQDYQIESSSHVTRHTSRLAEEYVY